MKNLFSFLVITVLSLSICQAQPTPPTPPNSSTTTTSSSSSETKININIDNDQKLKLRANDHDFDLDLDFGKVHHLDIRKILVKHLGTPKSSSRNVYEWGDSGKTYKIKLKKGSIEASIDKDELSDQEVEKLMSFVKDVFVELDWDVDIDGF